MIKPVLDNIVVKIEPKDGNQKTKSGIILPKASTQEKQDKGEVVAVGSGRILSNGDTIAPCVSEGQEIIFNSFAGTEVVVGEDIFLIIKETDVLAIL